MPVEMPREVPKIDLASKIIPALVQMDTRSPSEVNQNIPEEFKRYLPGLSQEGGNAHDKEKGEVKETVEQKTSRVLRVVENSKENLIPYLPDKRVPAIIKLVLKVLGYNAENYQITGEKIYETGNPESIIGFEIRVIGPGIREEDMKPLLDAIRQHQQYGQENPKYNIFIPKNGTIHILTTGYDEREWRK